MLKAALNRLAARAALLVVVTLLGLAGARNTGVCGSPAALTPAIAGMALGSPATSALAYSACAFGMLP